MNYDPLNLVADEPLHITASVLKALRTYRSENKFLNLPGQTGREEHARLLTAINNLTDDLIEGVEANPNKRWVMSHFQHYLKNVQQEDTEAREHFGGELEAIMDILGIESSDGLLNHYLVGI